MDIFQIEEFYSRVVEQLRSYETAFRRKNIIALQHSVTIRKSWQ
uniref:Uncharacterized protein n=1 Tax=Rhizophora mucronata TaxID=61149 RepID=A0A2P2N8F5_RHIMU